jgi:hypothetical protein
MAVDEVNLNTGNVVVGHFANGEDAQRAITELSDEGIQAHEIGAAFHSSSSFRDTLDRRVGAENNADAE